MERERPRYFAPLAVALAFVVSALYLAPSLISRCARYFPVGSGGDGAFYSMKLEGAIEGDRVLSCVQDPALRSTDSFLPRAGEVLWGRALRATVGSDIVLAHRWTYVLLAAVIFLLILATVYGLTGLPGFSLALSFWAMIEPATYYWKPFVLGHLTGDEGEFPYFRYANPMLMIVPLLAFLAALVHARASAPGRRAYVLWSVAALACGAVFYTQAYYWTWLGLTLLIFFALDFRGGHRRALIFMAGYGLLLGLPQIWNGFELQRDALVREVLHRGGCLIADREPHSLAHLGLLFTCFFYQCLCWRKWDWRWGLLTAAALGGWLALNQNMITGIGNQDHHYFRPLTPIYILVLADSGRRLYAILGPRFPAASGWARRHAAVLLAVVLLAFAARGAALSLEIGRGFDSPDSQGFKAEGLQRTLAALREHRTEPGSVLSDPELAYVIRIMGERPVYVHDYLHHCIFPDSELYARWGFLLRAFGKNDGDYRALLHRNAENTEIRWWLYGLPKSYAGPRDRNERRDLRQMAEACVTDYAGRDLDSFAKELRAAHGLPRYVLESPGFAIDRGALEAGFRLTLVAEVPEEKTRLYELASR